MTANTLVLPGGPAHRDDPATWTIPTTTPDVHAWRETQHARRGGLIAAMRLRNAEKFALEQAHRAAQEKAATPPAPRRHRGPDKAPRNRPACQLTACRTCTPCAHNRHDACRGESWCPNDQETRACECCGEAS